MRKRPLKIPPCVSRDGSMEMNYAIVVPRVHFTGYQWRMGDHPVALHTTCNNVPPGKSFLISGRSLGTASLPVSISKRSQVLEPHSNQSPNLLSGFKERVSRILRHSPLRRGYSEVRAFDGQLSGVWRIRASISLHYPTVNKAI
ncbi:hypothetical protein BDP27DRAFT_908862 [Rhodocollybia butyracea]|uniref:Uncharacterized protein n=1 Tax=Rhodocollybia butyracea TaxID=206335 RepID=A0A9P5U740_9AGAR|nr:hypothetical protein BDP27DRAFT_908862 [Rhodocollybia butyracea]